MVNNSRRKFFRQVGTAAACLSSGWVTAAESPAGLPLAPSAVSPAALARDEDYWRAVARYYDRTRGIVNLEHGFWGKMANPVKDAYLQATTMVNGQNSFYARKEFGGDSQLSVKRIAEALGAEEDEIVITRNATEAIHNLMRQYRGFERGDAVLYADVDYPSYKNTMAWLGEARGVTSVEVTLPARASQQQILDTYIEAFEDKPRLRLLLLTHVSNQHGLVVPVARIAAEAQRRGIDVICDAAQSWGLLDFKITDLNVDWAGFNLHKWIGAPVGTGALYMKRGSLEKIAPYPGDSDREGNSAAARIHSATSNFAAILAIPSALDFHEAVGAANKEARLRYLRSLWTAEADDMDHIEVLGGGDEESWTGMASIRLPGRTSVADANQLQRRLEQDFGIFTVIRRGLASGACVRVTPQTFTSADEIQQLVGALRQLAA